MPKACEEREREREREREKKKKATGVVCVGNAVHWIWPLLTMTSQAYSL